MKGLFWLFGLIVLFLGVAIFLGGLYVGGWLMFVGGIVDVIDQVKAPVTDSMAIALGVAKVFFFEVPIIAGIWLGIIIGGIGILLMTGKSYSRRTPTSFIYGVRR